MADIQIGQPVSVQTSFGNFTGTFIYDDVAQTVSVIPTGTGHAKLILYNNTVSPPTELNAAWLDQFGTTNGPVRQIETVTNNVGQEDAGHSASAVSYLGSRIILAGPGAQGIDAHGNPAPTQRVAGTIVGKLNPPKGQASSLGIELDWTAN